MTPSSREDHAATKPPQDGSVLLKTTDNEEHIHSFNHDNNWSQEPYGIVFSEGDPRPGVPERVVFPWTNIIQFEIFPNSKAYHQLMLQWLKDCDHDWLTHPRVGHYCQHCRLSMADLTNLYDDKLYEVPGLVSKADWVDRESVEHDPMAEAIPAVQDETQQGKLLVLAIEDPMEYCECGPEEDTVTDHEGPCRMKPETWPLNVVDPNEEGNGTF